MTTERGTADQILTRLGEHARLKSGLSNGQIAEFEGRLPGPVPSDIRQLLKHAAGFEVELLLPRTSVVAVSFTGSDDFGFPGEALPCPVPLMPDGFGNFWVVDVDPRTGSWGVVFFVCHDPPVIAVQARDVPTFLLQIVEAVASGADNPLTRVSQNAVTRIWKEDPWALPPGQIGPTADAVLRAFLGRLPKGDHLVIDLRRREVGSGFKWNCPDPAVCVRRAESELVFSVLKKTGLLSRLLGRSG